MLDIRCNSDTVIIVLHEIYGINSHIKGVCERLAQEKFDVICPNLLAPNQSFSYQEEALAYNNFMQNIGFSSAERQIESLSMQICNDYKYRFVIGFSVGATLAWLCSQREVLYSGVVGFYGSRIRDYKDIVPKSPVLLFFPRQEESFNVAGLTQELSTRENLCIIQIDALHGFADPWSSRYCSKASKETFEETIGFIKSVREVAP